VAPDHRRSIVATARRLFEHCTAFHIASSAKLQQFGGMQLFTLHCTAFHIASALVLQPCSSNAVLISNQHRACTTLYATHFLQVQGAWRRAMHELSWKLFAAAVCLCGSARYWQQKMQFNMLKLTCPLQLAVINMVSKLRTLDWRIPMTHAAYTVDVQSTTHTAESLPSVLCCITLCYFCVCAR
jgi:hypothetical protein